MASLSLSVKEDVVFAPLLRNYLKYRVTKQVAMRKKKLGRWWDYTWEDYYQNVVWVGAGLLKLGLGHGDKVGVIGGNDPEWIFAFMGTLAVGGIGVGLYVDSSPAEAKYILNHCGASFVFAKDQEAVDKMLSIASEVPTLNKIIYWDPKGLWAYEEPLLLSWEELIRLGKGVIEEEPELFQHAAERVSPDDTSSISYTSGTSGLPKGARYTHRSQIKRIAACLRLENIQPYYDEVIFLSPAWAAGVSRIDLHLAVGHTLNFPENPQTVQQNIREIAPHSIVYASRFWEDIISSINRRIDNSSRINRFIYKHALTVGNSVADCHFANVKPNLFLRIAYALCHAVVLRPIKDDLGLVRIVNAFTSAGSLAPESFRFLRAMGLNIKQIYGSSEAPIISFHRDGDVKFHSVGPKGCDELAITEAGEIMVKDSSLFVDYYKDPKATDEAFRDGWFHTGDAGYLDDDGHLVFWDRLSDLRQLKGGEKFSPLYIESRLRFSPYISDAICVGGDREYVAVLIAIDFENVGKWAERRKIPYTTFVDLSQRPEVIDLVKREVEVVNNTLPGWSRVLKLVNLPKELDPDEAELTRSRKLRRASVEERYNEIIDAIYEGMEELSTQVKVQYRDGTERVIQSKLKIVRI